LITGGDTGPFFDAIFQKVNQFIPTIQGVIDWIGIAFLTMPVFVPLITDLGMSPIWFGVLFCMNMQVSYLSPPFGPACFYLKSVAPPDVSLADIFRSVGPFIVLQAIAISLVMAFPQISLWPLKG
jgi:TRAP-type mannitol/chloroaromatic compound transport system permease large subunit